MRALGLLLTMGCADVVSTTEICGNGEDDDANGLVDCFDDACAEECVEDCFDLTDNDADGLLDCDDLDCESTCDMDGDGYWSLSAGGDDCDDQDPAVHPGAAEICNDGVDDDCNGVADDNDDHLDTTTLLTWYVDVDEDGFGNPLGWTDSCALPDGHAGNNTDCDDADPLTHPDANEACNGLDDDCDGLIDDDDDDLDLTTLLTWYGDVDLDGFAGDQSTAAACSPPNGYYEEVTDCDDNNDNIYPGAFEICNGIDEDCDTVADNDPVYLNWYFDADGDGFGDGSTAVLDCADLSLVGYVFNGSDCDDFNVDVNPAATEVCDEWVDNDCNGLADEDDPNVDLATRMLFYLDDDGDNHGDAAVSLLRCNAPEHYVVLGDDCDDSASDVHPGAYEQCNDLDDDCDQLVDIDDPDFDVADLTIFYEDWDQDGFGVDATAVSLCTGPVDWVLLGGDCNDADATMYPGGEEWCDELDNDCNGLVDDDYVVVEWHPDADGDEYGDAAVTVEDCTDLSLEGYTRNDLDCDDTNPDIHPLAIESCDGVDNDCDVLIDDEDPTVDPAGFTTWWWDEDGDGAGDVLAPIAACDQPDGSSDDASDCDDTNPHRYLGAQEICDDIDNNCDNLVDEDDPLVDLLTVTTWYSDGDGDGVGGPFITVVACGNPGQWSSRGDDCNDADDEIHPDAVEQCNGVDDDCNGQVDDEDLGIDPAGQTLWYADDDGDGFGGSVSLWACVGLSGMVETSDDCNDGDALVYPGAAEMCDGVDDDCDDVIDDGATVLVWYPDLDYDGFGDPTGAPVYDCSDLRGSGYSLEPTDCNDLRADVWPGHVEICGDLVDNDCDGEIDSAISGGDVSLYDSDAMLSGESSGDFAGVSVSGAGDVNGDGYGDLLIGAWDESEGGTLAGAAYVVEGPVVGTLPLQSAAAKLLGEDAWDHAGLAVAGAGDINLDGFDDVLVGAPGARGTGAAYLLWGPLTGTVDLLSSEALLEGVAVGDQAGYDVAAAGDVDGDGFLDLLIGAYGHQQYTGAAYLVRGPVVGTLSLDTAEAVLFGEAIGDRAGFSVSGAGDVNGDGFDDLVVGAPYADHGGSDAGVAYLIYGPMTGTFDLSIADARLIGESSGDHAGYSVAGIGDVDGDGFDDMVIGASDNDFGGVDAGAAYVVYGPVAGDLDLAFAARLSGEGAFGYAGSAVAGGGDINADGVPDVLVGAPFDDRAGIDAGVGYVVLGAGVESTPLEDASIARLLGSADGDAAGVAMAIAGDVDGDGIDDVIIGAWGVDMGDSDYGAAYLLRGCQTAP